MDSTIIKIISDLPSANAAATCLEHQVRNMSYIMKFLIFFFFLIFFLTDISFAQSSFPLKLEIKEVARYSHDGGAFTQGLVYDDGFLYESTGEYKSSTLRQVELKTGKAIRMVKLPDRYFAEGIHIVGNKIYQLTWREEYCFVYDKNSFNLIGQFRYKGEGWGITYDGKNLIMSDGSDQLTFLEPDNFKPVRKIRVKDIDVKTKKSFPVRDLNELEYINGEIWANIWQSTQVARINPETGEVIGRIEFAAFVPPELRNEQNLKWGERRCVLNGIAYDPKKKRIYITGKNWKILYEFEIVQPNVNIQ
ncbi:MAG: glutaminyl-peptide cyclotransferase [Planctomycetaceae bacterium]|jgi:glutamine cyclotransferase|nr:glutaminyl-peptide cyclotransferase [Planctomycetaceae bacterium]